MPAVVLKSTHGHGADAKDAIVLDVGHAGLCAAQLRLRCGEVKKGNGMRNVRKKDKDGVVYFSELEQTEIGIGINKWSGSRWVAG